VPVWPSLEAAQAAVDAFCREYNTERPHQALDMAFPADRLVPRPDQPDLPLQVPASLTTAPGCEPAPPAAPAPLVTPAAPVPPLIMSANGVDPVNLAVQLTRVVPACAGWWLTLRPRLMVDMIGLESHSA